MGRSCTLLPARGDPLTRRHLAVCEQVFLAEEGVTREDGTREDPTLPAFEAEVSRYRTIQVTPRCIPARDAIAALSLSVLPPA